MLTFKTKHDALENTVPGDVFIIEDRQDATFSVKEVKGVKYIVRIFGSKAILELADAIDLAHKCNLHIKSVDTINVFVDNYYTNQGASKSQCKRIISKAEVIDLDTGLSYIRTGSAGADNVGKGMGGYVNEMSNKRAIVRTILAALKTTDVYVDIEFSEDIEKIIKERNERVEKKYEEAVETKYVKKDVMNPDNITEAQIDAITNLLKTSKTKLSDITSGYKVKSLKELTKEQGKVVITTLKERGNKNAK